MTPTFVPSQKHVVSFYIASFLLLAYSLIPCIGFTSDSSLYLSTADRLLENGFYDLGFRDKPPLYATLLFLMDGRLGAITAFNLICWALNLYLFHRLLMPFLEDGYQRLILAFWVAFSTGLQMTHNFIWTEPLFFVFSTAFLLQLNSAATYRVLWLALLSLGMVSLRHTGVIIVAAGFGSLVLHRKVKARDFAWLVVPTGFFFLWRWHIAHIPNSFEVSGHFRHLDLWRNYRLIGEMAFHWVSPIHIEIGALLSPWLFLGLVVYAAFRSQSMAISAYSLMTVLTFILILFKGNLLEPDLERYFVYSFPLFSLGLLQGLYQLRLTRYRLVQIALLLLSAYYLIRVVKNSLQWHEGLC